MIQGDIWTSIFEQIFEVGDSGLKCADVSWGKRALRRGILNDAF